MTSLSTIDAEARRTLGRMPEPKKQALQGSLVSLCEATWPDLRGPEPARHLAKALWEIPPHCADIFLHLHGSGDARLAGILQQISPPRAMALLVLSEIERGDAEGARGAYAAMRLLESSPPTANPITPTGHAPGAWLRHAHRPALWRAVVGVAIRTGRWDTRAVLECIRLAARAQAAPAKPVDDADMLHILRMLKELGVTFLRAEEDHLVYALRGEEREPVRFKEVTDILVEGRGFSDG